MPLLGRLYINAFKLYFNFELDLHLREVKNATAGKHTRNRHVVIRPNLFTRILRFRVANFEVLQVPLSLLPSYQFPGHSCRSGHRHPNIVDGLDPSPTKHVGSDRWKSGIIALQGRQVTLTRELPHSFQTFFFFTLIIFGLFTSHHIAPSDHTLSPYTTNHF